VNERKERREKENEGEKKKKEKKFILKRLLFHFKSVVKSHDETESEGRIAFFFFSICLTC
jgi:hypothetical protein